MPGLYPWPWPDPWLRPWPGQTFELGTWHIAIGMATCLGPGTWAQCLWVIFLKHYHSAFFILLDIVQLPCMVCLI